MTTNIDKLGIECVKLAADIRTVAQGMSAQRKGYNESRKQATAELREKLTPIWAALKSGQAVNGQTSIEGWCKFANPSAKYPERQFQKIMSEGEVSSPRPKIVTVKPEGFVRIGTLTFKVKMWTPYRVETRGTTTCMAICNWSIPKLGMPSKSPSWCRPRKRRNPSITRPTRRQS